VPYTYQMLKRLNFEKLNLNKISKLTQAGGKLDINLVKYFSEHAHNKGIQFFVMYGQTEATARMSCLPAKDAMRKFGSIGLPIAQGEFFLIDETNKIISEPEVVGELHYKGPNVSMGYAYTFEDFIKGDENKGVLATGDMAKKDSDGYYYIVGRKKRFIKIFGNRISLDEVENILTKNEILSICTGVDDKLLIYTTQEEKLNEIKFFISTKIGIHHSAISVFFISEFPRNESGKILYSKLHVN
jgi:long-chain acyl-CoA synthetase